MLRGAGRIERLRCLPKRKQAAIIIIAMFYLFEQR